MKYKLLLLLLLIPELLCAQYTCSRLVLPGWWGSGEYLLLWRKMRFYPPLATTNSTNPPILGDPGTNILFGDKEVGNKAKSGLRFDGGFWITCRLGCGGSFFAVGNEEVDFRIDGNSAGLPIFGRPFFNTSTNTQAVQLISFPTLAADGQLDIETTNHLWGGDLYARYRLLGCRCFKLDFLGGFLYTRIDDDLDISTSKLDIDIVSPNVGSIINEADHFNCENNFYSGLVGFLTELRTCKWAIQVVGKLGLGNMVKDVEISGERTIIDPAGGVTIINGGLLALPSNIGSHSSNQFEVVSQINANMQFNICSHFWFTAGYMYMYWPRVALAGEQVDLNVNITQLIPPISGPLTPIFDLKDKSFWIQGLTVGFYILF